MHATPASIAAFDCLDNRRPDRPTQVRLLHALVDSIENGGLNLANRRRARRVLDGFDREARQHTVNEDAEEDRFFHALLASRIAPALEAASHGNPWFDSAELRHALQVFEARSLDHTLLQEPITCPEAKQRLAAPDALGMGREMAPRRTAPGTRRGLRG